MKKKIIILCLVCLVIGLSSFARAASLQDLFDGTDIIVGDKLFSEWHIVNEASTSLIFPDYSLVEVNPLIDQPLNPGLEFITNGQFSVSDLDFLDIYFGFTVSSLGPQFIKDNSLEITGYDFFNSTGGLITIEETVTDVLGVELAFKKVEVDNLSGVYNLYDWAEFKPGNMINVEKNILVFGDEVGDVVRLDSFTQRFSQTPEPCTIILFGIGLIAFAGAGRKKY